MPKTSLCCENLLKKLIDVLTTILYQGADDTKVRYFKAVKRKIC